MANPNLKDRAENAAASEEQQTIPDEVINELCTKIIRQILCNSKEQPKCSNMNTSETEKIATSVADASTQTSIGWYRAKGAETLNGRSLNKYFECLRQVKNYRNITFLTNASSEVPFIGCPNSVQAWKLLDPVIKYITDMQLYDMGVDIATILLDDPQSIHLYISCFTKMRRIIRSQEYEKLTKEISVLSTKIQNITSAVEALKTSVNRQTQLRKL